jgi:hypothetical protein
MLVPAYINGNCKDRLNVLDLTHTLIDKGIFVARSLIDINNHKTVLSVMNVNTCPGKLKTDSILGLVSQLTSG